MKKVVGIDTSHINAERMIFNRRAMYQIYMGYLDPSSTSLHRSIKYVPEEHAYEHPLSFMSTARHYALHQLKDLMPLEFYYNNPVEMVDEIVSGLTIGMEDRKEAEEEAKRQALLKEELAKQEAGTLMNSLHEQNN